MNTSISKHFDKLLLMAAFVVFSVNGLKGQSFIKGMGKGLGAPVACSCVDSFGNVYAVTNNLYDPLYGDTLHVDVWNITSKKWSAIGRLPGYYNAYINNATCNIMNGKFYVTCGRIGSNVVDLMQYNSGNWTNIAKFKMVPAYFAAISSIKFNNKLYFVGGFDSVDFQKMPNVMVYDGSTISSAGFPLGYVSGGLFESSMEIISDSLFLSANNRVLLHKSPSTWSIYKTLNSNINSMAAKNGILYVGSYNILRLYKNGAKVDSLNSGIFINSMKTFNNRIFINAQHTYYTLTNLKDIKPVFINRERDTNNVSFLATNGKLYFYGSDGVVINKVDYNNIIEILADSLKEVGYDTVLVKTFVDRNVNYKFDAGDQNLQYVTYRIDGYYDMSTNANGYFTLYPLENQDMDIVYQGGIQTDSCYKVPFSGNLSSKCYNSPITRDTLFYPFRRTTLKNRNLILRSYSGWGARMMDSTYLYYNVFNRDCDGNTSSAVVKIKLDSGTYFASSKPNYTSRNGNELTYNLSNIKPYEQSNYIILNVIYPISKYTIGQKVRHTARLTTTFTEDTMDNVDSIVQKMVYSYDPNAKHSVPEGKVTKDLKNIRYYVEFQNEGNDDAFRVTVVDTLNLSIPVYEFQMVGSSHPYSVSVTPGTSVVTWVFNNINLKPKSQNEPASKGYIIFDAKLKTNVKVGDSIRNKASIYFDYNKPIITNYAVINRVEPQIRIQRILVAETRTLKAYPNPAQDFIKIENRSPFSQDISVYDLKGALVTGFQLRGNEGKFLNTEGWARGMYLLKNNLGENFKFILD